MILTDVYVPSVSNHYVFKLDEKSKIGVIIAELTELICQKEQCRFAGDKDKLVLCNYQSEAIMSKDMTLRDYGITDGDRLILV